MKAEEAKRLKKREEENKRLKRFLAAAELDNAISREALGETDKPCTPQGSGQPSPAKAGRQRTLGVLGFGRTRRDAMLPAVARGSSIAAGGTDAGTGARVSALRLSANLGLLTAGGFAIPSPTYPGL